MPSCEKTRGSRNATKKNLAKDSKLKNGTKVSTPTPVLDPKAMSQVEIDTTGSEKATKKNLAKYSKLKNGTKVSTRTPVLDPKPMPQVEIDTTGSQSSTKRNLRDSKSRNAKASTKPRMPLVEEEDKAKELHKSKISDYFKASEKRLDICDMKKSQTCDSRQYYIDALKEALRSDEQEKNKFFGTEETDAIVSVADEVNNDQPSTADVGANAVLLSVDSANLQKEIVCGGCLEKSSELEVSQKKYRDLHKRYIKVMFHYNEVNFKYNELLKAGLGTGSNVNNEVGDDDIFSKDELKVLESVPLLPSNDSTFILECLKFVYQSDYYKLRLRTANGKASSTLFVDELAIEVEEKLPLTPEKVARIKQLFAQRLNRCNISSVEFGERLKAAKLNKLLNSSIRNITKKLK